MDDRRAVLERRLRVDDDRQRVVLDDHVLGGVDDRVLVRAEDDGDGLADVADLAAASGQWSGTWTSTPGGTQTIGHGAAMSVMSSPVNTASTPSRSRAAVSIETIRACASGERTIAA